MLAHNYEGQFSFTSSGDGRFRLGHSCSPFVDDVKLLAVCGATSNTFCPILDKYKDFSDVFEKHNADRLPEHRLYDCPIDLQEGVSTLRSYICIVCTRAKGPLSVSG